MSDTPRRREEKRKRRTREFPVGGYTAQKKAELELSSGTPPRGVSCRRNPRSCAGDCGWEELKLEAEPDPHAGKLHGQDGRPKMAPESPQMRSSRDAACGPCRANVRVCQEPLAIQREEIGSHSGQLNKLPLPTLLYLPPAG